MKDIIVTGGSGIEDNRFFYKIDQTESFDINTHHDFDVAKILYKKNFNN